MIATPLFAVAPLILAAAPVAAVPQRFWNAQCVDAVTVTETVSHTASSLASDDPQVTGPPERETVMHTVTVFSTLTATPTAEDGAISAAEAEGLSRPLKTENNAEKTVTVLSTVTDVSTVTVQDPQPTEDLSSASALSPDPDPISAASPDSTSAAVSSDSDSAESSDPTSVVSSDSNSEASPDSTSAVSADPISAASPEHTSDAENSPKSTATGIPRPLVVHPFYTNNSQAAPYNNSSLYNNSSQPTNGTSSSVVAPPLMAPFDNSTQITNMTSSSSMAAPMVAPFDNSSRHTNDTSSSGMASPVMAPFDNSSRSTNTSDTAPPAILTAAAFAAPVNSSQLANTTDTSSAAVVAPTVASEVTNSSDTASPATPIPSVSVPNANSSQPTTTTETAPPPTANPTAFGSAFSSFESANTNSENTLPYTTYSTYDSTYVPTDTYSDNQAYQSTSQIASDTSTSLSATATPSASASSDNSSQLPSDTSFVAPPSSSAFAYGGYENGVYFTNWGIYAADYQPQSLPSSLITRVIYAFANFESNGTVVSSDLYADLQNQYPTDLYNETGNNAYGCVKQLFLLKKQNRRLKTLLSIGGWTYSKQFPTVAADPAARQTFATSAVQLVTDWGFDGIEIDWEYPTNAAEAANFVLLLAAVRNELDAWAADLAPGYHFLLTVAAPAGPATYDIMDLEGMDAYVDSWNLMAYDYSGSWDTTTGHQANLYPNLNNTLSTKFNTDQAVTDYITRGIAPSKIVLGMPTFGRSFEATPGLGKPFTGVGPGSARLNQPGLWLYNELPRAGATELYDDVAKASYSYNNVTQELISYDNVQSAKVKKSYLISKGLGGVIFWEASGDTNGTDSLVATLANNLSGVQYQQNLLNYSTSQYDNIRNGVPGP